MQSLKDRLINVYELLKKRNRYQNWWPGKTQFEVVVGAILTQNTSWTNVEKAIINLRRERVLTARKMYYLSAEKLATLIRPAGFFNVKTKRLRNFLTHLHDNHSLKLKQMFAQDIGCLRDELLSINGIGRETADSIILYAAEKPTFVVDSYTKRIFSRHDLCDKSIDYDDLKNIIESVLPLDAELFNDYHAQIVVCAKEYCKIKPLCEQCPLKGITFNV